MVYLSVIEKIRNMGGEKYPPIVIYNLSFSFAIEREVIVQGVNSKKMIPYLLDGAKILENSGVDFGILPCNTLHKFMPEMRKAVKFPFLSILEETASELKKRNIKKIGMLATETTVRSKIYEDALKNSGIGILYPSESGQNIVNNIIVELLAEKENNSRKGKLEEICGSLSAQGAEAILLACTDLQLIASEIKASVPIIDTTEILIDASVREMTH